MNDQLALTFDSMTEDEALILEILQGYVGKKYAVNQRFLSKLTCLAERTVRKVIASLISKHRKRICSSYESGKGGYYLPANDAEVEETCGKLHSHAIHILMRESALKKITMTKLLAEYQRELPFKGIATHV